MDEILAAAGFKRNPFKFRESSGDPHLVDYIVNSETFALAWADEPALILAAAGAGKTAMRIFTARTCWTSLGRKHPFPLPYYLPQHFDGATFFSREAHLQAIVRAGAASLLLGLAYRPEYLLNAAPEIRLQTARLLANHLPSPLRRYLEILQEEQNVQALPPLLDRAYVLPEPPSRAVLLEMCTVLGEALAQLPSYPGSPGQAFTDLTTLLLDGYQFRSILLLLDGVDGFADLGQDAALTCQALAPVVECIPAWTKEKVYFKGFLPLEMSAAFQAAFKDIWELSNIRLIHWEPDELAGMLRRRVAKATGGNFGSLDAISSPALRDVETQLVKECPALPRHVIIFAERVLLAAYQRCEGHFIQISPEDIETARKGFPPHS